jgi:hypothetical protein
VDVRPSSRSAVFRYGQHSKPLVRETSPFLDKTAKRGVIWIEPRIAVEVSYSELMQGAATSARVPQGDVTDVSSGDNRHWHPYAPRRARESASCCRCIHPGQRGPRCLGITTKRSPG